ncbi:D-tyrosyl-tRNA(Tyr) deacylase [bacterium]|nr:D-tyrosyl-tRNA(Tyr) deacylase [bacterium]
MIALVQRVRSGSVEVNGEIVGSTGRGFVVLVGVCADDEPSDAMKLAEKVYGLRVFEDHTGKFNLSISDVGGSILAVSQFTLCADTTKGRRPSFARAMEPERAKNLFDAFVELLRAKGIHTETGIFGAKMLVKIENDGPVTLWLDSKAKRKK